jgi:hypothetical protein
MGGSNNKENLVLLTAREHYVVHKLLHRINKNNDKLFWAWHMMAFKRSSDQKRLYKVSSYDYLFLKTNNAILASKRFKGFIHSDETKRKMSESKKGIKFSDAHKENMRISANARKNRGGYKLTDEQKHKISLAHKGLASPMFGKFHSEISKKKISRAHKGKVISDEQRKIQSERMKGRKQTDKHISNRFRNRINPMLGIIPWNKKVVYNNEEYIARKLKAMLMIKTYKELTGILKNEKTLQT